MKAYYDAHRKSLRKLLDRAAGAVVFVSTDEGAALENVECTMCRSLLSGWLPREV